MNTLLLACGLAYFAILYTPSSIIVLSLSVLVFLAYTLTLDIGQLEDN